MSETLDFRRYPVSAADREPLLRWMVAALGATGCRILRSSEPDQAPFRLTFETPMGERLGIVAYAFLANSRLTKNRPPDEHRFQIKYGPHDELEHELWQDPYDLYTTLLLGINVEQGFFVAADPVLHSPTRFFISLEFKERHAREILERRWFAWERVKRDRRRNEYPVEVLVGGTAESFLRYVRFEQAAKGLDPGHRQLLAEKLERATTLYQAPVASALDHVLAKRVPHALAKEFELTPEELLDLIGSAPRLKMAVRGWVAEEHLYRRLVQLPGVDRCIRLETEGGADLQLSYRGSRPLTIECKNVLRQASADGRVRLDFQRTRASKTDPCSRFYAPDDFDVVAACLHSRTEEWEFRYALTDQLDPHRNCPGKLSNLVRLDGRWHQAAEQVLAVAAARS